MNVSEHRHLVIHTHTCAYVYGYSLGYAGFRSRVCSHEHETYQLSEFLTCPLLCTVHSRLFNSVQTIGGGAQAQEDSV